ncbi:MAG TPA: 30S ribosome-binding factor RbfA, partial [Gammaproteobacteria bacterium]
MAKEFHRSTRVGEQMQRELASMIGQVLEDPRVGLLTVTEVRLNKDLSHAKVFVSSIGGDLTPDELVAALQHAAG